MNKFFVVLAGLLFFIAGCTQEAPIGEVASAVEYCPDNVCGKIEEEFGICPADCGEGDEFSPALASLPSTAFFSRHLGDVTICTSRAKSPNQEPGLCTPKKSKVSGVKDVGLMLDSFFDSRQRKVHVWHRLFALGGGAITSCQSATGCVPAECPIGTFSSSETVTEASGSVSNYYRVCLNVKNFGKTEIFRSDKKNLKCQPGLVSLAKKEFFVDTVRGDSRAKQKIFYTACVKERIQCTDKCSVQGSLRCSVSGIPQECNVADGCLNWKDLSACSPESKCSDGKCVLTCTDECPTAGSGQCSTSGNPQTCAVDGDSDPCLEWKTLDACSSTQTCVSGNCITTATTTIRLGKERLEYIDSAGGSWHTVPFYILIQGASNGTRNFPIIFDTQTFYMDVNLEDANVEGANREGKISFKTSTSASPFADVSYKERDVSKTVELVVANDDTDTTTYTIMVDETTRNTVANIWLMMQSQSKIVQFAKTLFFSGTIIGETTKEYYEPNSPLMPESFQGGTRYNVDSYKIAKFGIDEDVPLASRVADVTVFINTKMGDGSVIIPSPQLPAFASSPVYYNRNQEGKTTFTVNDGQIMYSPIGTSLKVQNRVLEARIPK